MLKHYCIYIVTMNYILAYNITDLEESLYVDINNLGIKGISQLFMW